MKKHIKFLMGTLVLLLLPAEIFAADTAAATTTTIATTAAVAKTPAVIPLPVKMTVGDGVFKLLPGTKIVVDTPSLDTGKYLAGYLNKATGYQLVAVTGTDASLDKGSILLTTKDAKASLGAEGYELTVTPDSVIIRAPEQAGLFYGVQSLLQLLPVEIFSQKPVTSANWEIPGVQIEDQPRFKWRGLMLDVSRHFFNKQEVEQVLDGMALHKMNTFHWHLTDEQGWRIEIKKYPLLTQVGAWRDNIDFNLDPKASIAYGPDGRYGGYYTQDDIREVVAYAQARHITVVPEIEMPGHSNAALLAYPEYASPGGLVFDPANEKTFTFLQDILTEVIALFPSKFIHIGGDEVNARVWQNSPDCVALMQTLGLQNSSELEGYFIGRIEKFINANGRTLIGWSEIVNGGLPPNAALMDWKGAGTEVAPVATAGHDVVSSPQTFCYLDHLQSRDRTTEPRAIGGAPVTLAQTYAFEPIPAILDPQFQSHVIGGQGNLWTEQVPSIQHVEYMLFPRAIALSEVLWSTKESRNWDGFLQRLPVDCHRLNELGINYRPITDVVPDAAPAK